MERRTAPRTSFAISTITVHVARHDQMLVRRRAIAEVIAHLDRAGHGIAQTRELGGDLPLVVGGPMVEEVLIDQDLLADVPLDGEILGRNSRDDVVEGPTERALVHRDVPIARMRAHVHVGARHRRGQTHLEADR